MITAKWFVAITILVAIPSILNAQTPPTQTPPTQTPPTQTPPTQTPPTQTPPADDSSTTNAGQTSSMYTLGLVGIDATGSSSSGPSQQYFAEFDLIAPLPWLGHSACDGNGKANGNGKTNGKTNGNANDNDRSNDPLSRKCWVWLNPRIASVPTASNTALSSLNSTSLTTGIGSQTIGQITQSFEFQGGVEYYLVTPSKAQTWGLANSWASSAVSLIVGGGALTPFNSVTTAPEFGLNSNLAQQFNQNPNLESQYPVLASALCDGYGFVPTRPVTCPAVPATKPTTVAFVFPNRSRFYRSFYGGVRLRFFYLTGSCGGKSQSQSQSQSCTVDNTYPGTFDVRFGEDESVTSGHLVPLVMTLTGSFPIPGTKGALRVFGSTYLRARGNVNTPALVLVPSTSFTSLDNSLVAVQPIPRSDQDYFRLGIGVDLIALATKFVKSNPSATTNSH
jgi:hypothetical protein